MAKKSAHNKMICYTPVAYGIRKIDCFLIIKTRLRQHIYILTASTAFRHPNVSPFRSLHSDAGHADCSVAMRFMHTRTRQINIKNDERREKLFAAISNGWAK